MIETCGGSCLRTVVATFVGLFLLFGSSAAALDRPPLPDGERLSGAEREVLIERIAGGASFLDPITAGPLNSIIGQCIDWGDVAFMLGPNMSVQQATTFVDGLPPSQGRRYQPNNTYWARTATNGNVSVPGQRITITWSFVPDGTLIDRAYSPGQAGSNLFAILNSAFANEEQWKNQFRRAFDEFGELIGVDYVEVQDDGAAQPAVGVPGVRGDVRIGMIEMGASGPLAFNYYPTAVGQINSLRAGLGGDMVFNSDLIFLLSGPNNQFRYLRNVIMHEHGHGLGYRHVSPVNQTKLMEPYATTAFDGPQQDDIRGFQNGYGDRFENNNTPANATDLGLLPTSPNEQPLLLNNLALENSAAVDNYRFTVPDLTVLLAKVEPFGSQYLQGPQDGPSSSINALAVLDLVMDVMDADGVVTLATADSNGLGEGEDLEIPLLLGPGEYLVRVRSKGSNNQSQRYRMTLSRRIGSADATYIPIEIAVDDSAGNRTGTPDPGEKGIELMIPLRNVGFSFGAEFNATLLTDTPTVTIINPTVRYSEAFANQRADQFLPFRFSVSPDHLCGDPILFRLVKTLATGEKETDIELSTGIIGLGPFRKFSGNATDPGSLQYLTISTIFIDQDFPIGDVRIRDLHVTASQLENHRFLLVSPTGLTTLLADGSFKGSRLQGSSIVDGSQSITTGQSPYTGTYRPTQPMNSLASGSAFGEWQLIIVNKTGARSAFVESWDLEVAPYFEEPFCAAPLIFLPGDIQDGLSIY